MRKDEKGEGGGRGYGGLFSIVFADGVSAASFYDALDVQKGPSLGTNFTLCCPYTLLVRFIYMYIYFNISSYMHTDIRTSNNATFPPPPRAPPLKNKSVKMIVFKY